MSISICSTALAQSQTEKKDALVKKQLYNEVLKYYNQEANFNGVVLVADNGKIDFLSGIGLSNRQYIKKINAEGRFDLKNVIDFIDLRQEKIENNHILSRKLREEIAKNLLQKKQICI